MRARPRNAGFSYVAVMVALMLLAVCAAPAADAVRNAGAASAVSATQLRSLLCLKSRMELVTAEPYQKLLGAASGAAAAPAYSLAADAGCPQRDVFIRIVSVDSEGLASYPATDTGLLQLVVTLPDAAPGSPPLMSLATMVTR